ncbi:hypothetical protein [Actinomadura rupiterrae]|uniref:hypothetical protein n=1 Tax=Actinomadura rupiterrae TaxID=559627 RepID=UPI0020A4B445|nr:hypothetical protein [Actinomadura rupiterrae]MCP2336726.1 hypothetical protein [Actinomadura rupiterrae]
MTKPIDSHEPTFGDDGTNTKSIKPGDPLTDNQGDGPATGGMGTWELAINSFTDGKTLPAVPTRSAVSDPSVQWIRYYSYGSSSTSSAGSHDMVRTWSVGGYTYFFTFDYPWGPKGGEGPKHELGNGANSPIEQYSVNAINILDSAARGEDTKAVRLGSFDELATQFGQVISWLETTQAKVKGWQSGLGGDEAALKGEAADEIWKLIDRLSVGFTLLHDHMSAEPPMGVALLTAKNNLVTALNSLRTAYWTWRADPLSMPMGALSAVVDEWMQSPPTNANAPYRFGNGMDASLPSFYEALSAAAKLKWLTSVGEKLDVPATSAMSTLNNAYLTAEGHMQRYLPSSPLAGGGGSGNPFDPKNSGNGNGPGSGDKGPDGKGPGSGTTGDGNGNGTGNGNGNGQGPNGSKGPQGGGSGSLTPGGSHNTNGTGKNGPGNGPGTGPGQGKNNPKGGGHGFVPSTNNPNGNKNAAKEDEKRRKAQQKYLDDLKKAEEQARKNAEENAARLRDEARKQADALAKAQEDARKQAEKELRRLQNQMGKVPTSSGGGRIPGGTGGSGELGTGNGTGGLPKTVADPSLSPQADGSAAKGQGGVPLYPPTAGAQGGGAGGQQNAERERTTWVSEDEGTWQDGKRSAGVLGRRAKRRSRTEAEYEYVVPGAAPAGARTVGGADGEAAQHGSRTAGADGVGDVREQAGHGDG